MSHPLLPRIDFTEIHESSWFPHIFRQLITEALAGVWTFPLPITNVRPAEIVVPILKEALESTKSTRVIDLCSGGGGPLPIIADEFAKIQEKGTVEFLLTDLYPNVERWKLLKKQYSNFSFEEKSVNAVETELPGFRTLFLSLHHFTPSFAKEIFRNVIKQNEGIAVFELQSRLLPAVISVPISAFLVGFLTPFILPFSPLRLLFTYVIPMVPVVTGFDGLLSALRSHSKEELEEMVREVDTQSKYNTKWVDVPLFPIPIGLNLHCFVVTPKKTS